MTSGCRCLLFLRKTALLHSSLCLPDCHLHVIFGLPLILCCFEAANCLHPSNPDPQEEVRFSQSIILRHSGFRLPSGQHTP